MPTQNSVRPKIPVTKPDHISFYIGYRYSPSTSHLSMSEQQMWRAFEVNYVNNSIKEGQELEFEHAQQRSPKLLAISQRDGIQRCTPRILVYVPYCWPQHTSVTEYCSTQGKRSWLLEILTMF